MAIPRMSYLLIIGFTPEIPPCLSYCLCPLITRTTALPKPTHVHMMDDICYHVVHKSSVPSNLSLCPSPSIPAPLLCHSAHLSA